MKYEEEKVKKKTISFKKALKKSLLGNKPNHGVKDLYAESYRTSIKEIKDDSKKMERFPMLLDWVN